MSTINILDLESREKPPNQRQHFISNIMALGPSYKQRRTIKSRCLRILEWKITHLIQSKAQDPHRHTKRKLLALYIPHQISEQKLPNGQSLVEKARIYKHTYTHMPTT